tara:strand:- start:440 stop:670 length:231 start_codon:yes stop_codon:yes gene_type:complete
MENKYLYHLEYNEEQNQFHFNTDPQIQEPFTFGWRTLMHCETLDELCEKFERLDKKMKWGKKYTHKELQKIIKNEI